MASPAFQFLTLIAATTALFFQVKLMYLGLSPVTVVMPDLPVLPPDDRLNGIVEKIGEDDLLGPEGLVVSARRRGGGVVGRKKSEDVLFATLGDGRIVRLSEEESRRAEADDGGAVSVAVRWETVLRTGGASPPTRGRKRCGAGGPTDDTNTEGACGRPLGLALAKRSTVDPTFEETGSDDEDVLIVADSYKGLLMVSGIYEGDEARMTFLSTRADGDKEDYTFQLLNAAVQAPDGSIYVTETSRSFQRRRIFYAVFDGHLTGRLLRYQKGRGVEVVADGLYMPNGVTLSHGGDAILVVSGVQILKFSLQDQKLEEEPFVHVMPGTGDNIKTFDHLPTGERRRCYWAGLGSKFAQPFSLLKALSEKPLLRAVLVSLVPYKTLVELIPKLSALAVYDESGNLIETYQDANTTAPWLSEGEPMGEHIYLGSWYNPYLARVKKQDLIMAAKAQ